MLLSLSLFAQEGPKQDSIAPPPLSNLRSISLVPLGDTLLLDSLTVIPATLAVKNAQTGETIDKEDYTIQDNLLVWKKRPDSIDIDFRVFPYAFSNVNTKKDTAWIGFEEQEDVIIRYTPKEGTASLFTYDGLDYSGSFSRGISFGNNQDLVLNSSFNLQLSGDIGDDIEILAAISDNNIPLQPEGNTQQLQEFDQLFIQLKRKNTVLIAGDYKLSKPTGYFMNYYRRLQGASLNTEVDVGKNGSLAGRISGAVQRGQFARNSLVAIEGNQGPYKLTGNKGERFIIVLAGTEKVFIDGLLLTRGSENDYVIDYNTAEVTFTTKRLITKDRRIVIEFNYSVDSYLRTLYGVNLEYKHKKFNVYFNQFSEQDGKNQVGGQELTPLQRERFQAAGDQVESILFPSLNQIEFDSTRVMYSLVDTMLVNGQVYDSVFVYTPNRDSAEYTVSFTEVGPNQGDYLIQRSSNNGRIYYWVAPDSLGNPQGSYVPKVRLAAPQRKQLYTLGTEYQLNKNASILAEVALSNNDKNSFSEVDDNDNLGLAVRSSYKHKIDLSKKDQKEKLTLSPYLDYEFVHQDFEAIETFRAIEFQRDWNVDPAAEGNEHIARGGFELKKEKWGHLRYEFGTFLKDSVYNGTKHFASSRFYRKGFDLLVEGSYLQAEATAGKSEFFRPKVNFSKTFEKLNGWTVGVYGEREQNRRFQEKTDTLLKNSFYYDIAKAYIKNDLSENLRFEASYQRRFDYAPDTTQFELATIADQVAANGQFSASRHHRLSWNMTYRNLQISDTLLTKQKAQKTYLGRVEYSLNILGGFIRSNTIYELGSGQQQRIEYTYIIAPNNQGTHAHVDYNEDGLEQINEFEIPQNQDEATHIRITTFTDNFIRTNNVLFSQSIGLNPKKLKREKELGKTALFFRRFSTQTVLRINRRTLESDEILPWNPFQFNIQDSSLVSTNSNIRNTLYFNRINPKYSLEFGLTYNNNRVVLTSGFDSREKFEQSLKARWNISRKISSNYAISHGVRTNDSEFFQNKDYQIEYYEIEPELTLLVKRNFRAKFKYNFKRSTNQNDTLPAVQQDSLETMVKNDFSMELTYNKVAKTEIRSRFSFALVDFKGTPNTPVSYALLEGLQDGRNYQWNLTVERRVAKNVLLSMSYEGRKTGEARIVHVGRASIRATF